MTIVKVCGYNTEIADTDHVKRRVLGLSDELREILPNIWVTPGEELYMRKYVIGRM